MFASSWKRRVSPCISKTPVFYPEFRLTFSTGKSTCHSIPFRRDLPQLMLKEEFGTDILYIPYGLLALGDQLFIIQGHHRPLTANNCRICRLGWALGEKQAFETDTNTGQLGAGWVKPGVLLYNPQVSMTLLSAVSRLLAFGERMLPCSPCRPGIHYVVQGCLEADCCLPALVPTFV